jgi:lysophospholipase L1-like esterase
LWIGDSHASFFADAPLQRFAVTATADAVVWLGPRLMYSLSRDGFPDPLLPELKRGLDLTTTPIILTAGEIDCRVHLVERRHCANAFAFVADYVARVSELRMRLDAPQAFLVGPVPPSDVGPENSDLPRNGTLAERVAVSRALEVELCESVIRLGDPAISAVPLGPHLGDPHTGELAQHLSLDGCHVNPLGSRTVREELARAASARPRAVA